MKRTIKKWIGRLRCITHRIRINETNHKGIYIGKRCNICGGKNIELASGVTIRQNVDLWCGSDAHIRIGLGSEIGERVRISIINSLDIGNKVLISPNCYITDCDHEYKRTDIPIIDQGIVNRPNSVCICDGAYIGINTVIVGNVKIRKNSVIGANSVVTKDVPDYCVAVGSLCRVIKKYLESTRNWEGVC